MTQEIKKFNVEFDELELENLVKLIDIATRTAGLEVAKISVNLVDKIMEVVKLNNDTN
jgi:hypothetical protein